MDAESLEGQIPDEADLTSDRPWPDNSVGPLLRARARQVVPVIGAGVSVGSGLPSGDKLADWIRDHELSKGVDFAQLGEVHERNVRHVSQAVIDSNPALRVDLLDAVTAHIRDLAADAAISDTLRHLAAVPSGLAITLNYDDLLERAAREAGREVVPLGLADAMRFVADGAPTDGALRVVHLHGTIERGGEPIVLDEGGYEDRDSDRRVLALFSSFVWGHTLLFVGTRLQEPHVLSALSTLRPSSPRHVFVCSLTEARAIARGAAGAALTPSQRLITCSYPDGEYAVLDRFLSSLVSEAPLRDPKVSLPQDEHYTPRRLALVDDERDPHMAALLGRAEVVDETALRQRPRVVVVGPAGAGKSHLLQHLLVSADAESATPVLVRLRQVVDLIGPEKHLLQHWLDVAENPTEFDAQLVWDGAQPVHLLLDGLDELVPRRREAAIDAIHRVAEKLPHVRITLTSRPAAALASLDQEWQRFTLLCDEEWQQELLGSIGTNLDALRGRLGPAAARLEPLLRVPFYLRRLAEASDATIASAIDRGEPAGVVIALLNELLSDDPTLRAVAPGLQEWLTRCALLMQLIGKRQFGLATITELAKNLRLGNVEEVAQKLAARSLLQDSADSWTFEHRILAEALVANALLNEKPDEWLDIMAPQVDGRSALIEDWLEVARFLAEKDPAWRAQLTQRDPVTAARFTPPTAPVEERLQAAQVLWQHAADRQIWLDGALGQPDDGELIGTLVPRPAPDWLVADLDDHLAHGSRYDRANAMDILARIQPDQASCRLRHSLMNDPDSTVRRSSASWARRLDLTDLRDVVAARAENFEDSSEAEDMASIALRLTPPADRPALGARLRAAGNDKVHEHHVLEGVEPMERVRWWLAAAQSEPQKAEYGGSRKLAETLHEIVDPTEEDVATVAELASYLGTPLNHDVRAWLGVRADSAAVGIVRALRSGQVFEPYVRYLALAVGSAALRRADAPQPLIEWVESAEEAAREQPSPSRGSQGNRQQGEQDEPEETASPLADALDLDENEAIVALQQNESSYLDELGDHTGELARRVTSFILDIWRGRDLRSGITVNGTRARVEIWASVVLTYGAKVVLPLDDQQWQEVALCCWLFNPQHEWLRESSTTQRLERAVAAAPADARVIGDLLQIVPPDGDPSVVLARIDELPDDDWQTSRGEHILDLLATHQRLDLLRDIAGRSTDLAKTVQPLLARAGDVEAQRAALADLTEQLRSGREVSENSYPFLAAITSESLLEPVLDAFERASQRRHEYDPFDVTNGLLAAVERIGGAKAIAAISAIAAEPRWEGAQWLFRSVDRMVQQALATQAREAAERMRRARGLPPVAES